MPLFRRPVKATQAQLGAAAVPAAHTSNDVPLADAGRDSHRDELPGTSPELLVLPSRPSYRAPQYTQQAPGPATMDPALASHVGGGRPDPRMVYDGPAEQAAGRQLSAESLQSGPELLHNETHAVGMREQLAPERPRAGLTGADPARPAVMRLWTFMRPFDKAAADNLAPDGFGKIDQASPLAARPIESGALAGAEPSASGAAGTAPMDPVAPQPNSYRLMPRAWDELLVNTGGPAATPTHDPAQTASSAQARRSWRLT